MRHMLEVPKLSPEPRTIDQKSLVADLESLEVERAFGGFLTTANLGSYLPTQEAWQEGLPEQIGGDIAHVLRKDEATLRVYASSEYVGLARWEEIVGRFTGRPRTRRIFRGQPLHAAEVKEVAQVQIMPFERERLPLLRLMEYGGADPDHRLVISVAELAYNVQAGEAEVTLD